MTFKPTTLERAYRLAEGGNCQIVTSVKQQLQVEGYSNIQGQLYGLSVTNALRQRCKINFEIPRAA